MNNEGYTGGGEGKAVVTTANPKKVAEGKTS